MLTDPTTSIPAPWLSLAQTGGVVTPALPAQPQADAAPAAAGSPATTAPPAGPQPAAQPQGPGGFNPIFFLIIAMLLVMFLPQIFGSRKQAKKRAQLLASIKKFDKVQTTAGIIGTVAELRDDEVVLRVDENSNTRIRFARSAISQVLKSSATGGANGSDAAVEVKNSTQGAKV